MQFDATWPQQIEALHHELCTLPLLTDKSSIIPHLSGLLMQTVQGMPQEYAIAFSGGIDCTLLALLSQQARKRFCLFSVGLENSDDLYWAEKVSRFFGWTLLKKVLSLDEVHGILKKVASLLPRRDVVTLSVGVVGYAVLELARQHRQKALMTGLGAEEIFAGYDRHARMLKEDKVHEESWRGFKLFWDQDLTRDLPLFRHFGIQPLCPFLDDAVIRYAMQIHPGLKINTEHKKIILREVAESLGIPQEFAWRKKKAAQYGSAIDKALKKLAKQHGFKEKGLFLESLP